MRFSFANETGGMALVIDKPEEIAMLRNHPQTIQLVAEETRDELDHLVEVAYRYPGPDRPVPIDDEGGVGELPALPESATTEEEED